MSSSVGDIAAALAYQVKKEIAENFFGGRRELEEEREDLQAQGKKIQKAWDQEVVAPLGRIAALLMDAEAGEAFRALIGQEGLPGLAPQSPELTFAEARGVCELPFSFTSKGKYRALVNRLYLQVWDRSRKVLERFDLLQKKIKLHNEEVIKFGSSYNLSEILSFIKAMEGADELKGVLGENIDPRAVPELERKLLMKTLPPGSVASPSLKPLPEFKQIREPLQALVDGSYDRHLREIKACLKGRG